MRVHETAASSVLFMGASLIERTEVLAIPRRQPQKVHCGSFRGAFEGITRNILTSPNSI